MTYAKQLSESLLFAVFSSIIGYSFAAQAADIDVLSDPDYYDTTNNVVTSPDVDTAGNPIIKTTSYNDKIIFEDGSDPTRLITISGFSDSPFVMQGQSFFLNPIAVNPAEDDAFQELQINGTLTNDNSNITDLSKLILRINNYSDDSEAHPGELNLISSIKLGDLYMSDNTNLTGNTNNDTNIELYGNISFLGDTTIESGKNMNIEQMGQGSISSEDMLVISGQSFSTDVTIDNSGEFTIRSAATKLTNVNNEGSIKTSGNTDFLGVVTNSGHAVLNTYGNTTFDAQVNNKDYSTITTTGTTTFNDIVNNEKYAQFNANSGTEFKNTFNNADDGFLMAEQATFSTVNNSGMAYVEATDSTFTTFNNNDNAELLIIGGASGIFYNNDKAAISIRNGTIKGEVNNNDFAAITTTGATNFSDVINNSGSAKITTNGTTYFNDQINNSDFATITTNKTANFNATVISSDNAQITTNAQTTFDGTVNNTGNSKITLNGVTDFNNTVTNSNHGEININDTTTFFQNFTNDTGSTLNIRGNTTFKQAVVNSGHSDYLYPTINIEKQTTFSDTLINGLYARIITKAATDFSSVTNEGNITTNATADFNGTFNNKNNFTANKSVVFNDTVTNDTLATMNLNGTSTFNQNVSNQGNMNINNIGSFQQNFTNSGNFNATDEITFAQNVTNDNSMFFNKAANFNGLVTNNNTLEAKTINISETVSNSAHAWMILNKINFTNSQALLSNYGLLYLTDATLTDQLINNTGGYIDLQGLTTLNNDWSSDGSLSISPNSSLRLGNHRLTVAEDSNLNLYSSSSVILNINQDSATNGKISGNVKLNGNVSLNPIFAYGLTDGSYNFVDGLVDTNNGTWTDYNNNLIYNVSIDNNNSLIYEKKTTDEIVSSLDISENQAETLDAIMSGDSSDASFNQVAENISTLLQSNDTTQKQKALDIVEAIAPETATVHEQVAAQISGEVFDVVGARLAHRPSPQYRGGRRGLSSGDSVFETGAMWIQGMGSKAELKDSDKMRGFESTTAGTAMGFEKQANDNIRVGLGYAYSQTEIDNDIRNADVSTHSAIFYSEYKHPQFFMNVIANYGWSDYNEDSLAASADYIVESMGMQAMIGYYGLSQGVIRLLPEIGARYIHTKQHEYTNSIGINYDDTSNDVFTGIVGARITAIGGNANGLKIIPEAKIAFTYDIENGEDNETLVTLPNGASYIAHGKGLNRFGIEVGAGITAEINDKVDLSVSYEGRFRKDYSDHTGMVKGQYKF